MRTHLARVGLLLVVGFLVATHPVVADAARQVTGAQIKNGTITSADVKNRSLLARDFKPGELPRRATGATGPTGPAGTPAVSLFVTATEAGTIRRSSSGVSVTQFNAGTNNVYYRVDFPELITGCTPVVSLGANLNDSVAEGAIYARVYGEATFEPTTSVEVAMHHPTAAGLIPGGFSLIVAC